MNDLTYQPGISRKQGGAVLICGTNGRFYLQGGTAAGAGHSPLIWDDCPALNMLYDPTLGFYYHEDFQQFGATTKPWELNVINSTVIGLAANQYGVIRFANAATDNDAAYIASNNDNAGIITANATNDWWFEARVKNSQITTAQGIFVGLAEEAAIGTDFLATDAMTVKDLDYIGFHVLAATDVAAIWRAVMRINGGSEAVITATAATAAAATWIKLGMKSVSGTVTFYVDGVALAATAASDDTDFPLDQNMEIVFGIKNGKAAVGTLDVDWVTAAQLR